MGRPLAGWMRGGVSVTVIYVDTLFLLNAIIDYLLLLSAARLAGEPLRRLQYKK